jgi:hypothetical protein
MVGKTWRHYPRHDYANEKREARLLLGKRLSSISKPANHWLGSTKHDWRRVAHSIGPARSQAVHIGFYLMPELHCEPSALPSHHNGKLWIGPMHAFTGHQTGMQIHADSMPPIFLRAPSNALSGIDQLMLLLENRAVSFQKSSHTYGVCTAPYCEKLYISYLYSLFIFFLYVIFSP